MRNTKAIFFKQTSSQLKSPVMIFQAVLFLLIVLIMSFFMSGDDDECYTCIPAYVCATCLEEASAFYIPDISIAALFAVMFVGLTLVSMAAALVNEDKSTQNLRFLAMANVKPYQYMLGTLASMFIISFVIIILFAIVGQYFGTDMLWFVAIATSGAVVSILLGAAIALSKFAVVLMPVSLVLGMGPMLSEFNEGLANTLRFTYTQQIRLAVGGLGYDMTENFIIIGLNGLVALWLFVFVHRKGKLIW